MHQVPGSRVNPTLLVTFYFALKILPIIFSGMSIYLGYRLFILGVTGEASINVDAQTVKGQLINAAPGLFFAVGGIICLIVSIIKGVQLNFSNGTDRLLSNRAL